MRKHYLQLASMFCALTLCIPASAQNVSKIKTFNSENKLTQKAIFNICGNGLKMGNANDLPMLPQKESEYVYNDGEWFHMLDVTYEYNDFNKINRKTVLDYNSLANIPSCYEWTYVYDINGEIIEEREKYRFGLEGEWTDVEYRTYKYDEIFKDFITYLNIRSWDDYAKEWRDFQDGSFQIDIQRDEFNRVLDEKIYRSLDKAIPVQEWKYVYDDNEGPAKKISYILASNYDDDSEVKEKIYDNIEWYTSDCQYLSQGTDYYNPMESNGKNVGKSYDTYFLWKDGTLEHASNSQYTVDDKFRITKVITKDDEISNLYSYTVYGYSTPENPYDTMIHYSWCDYNHNNVFDPGEEINTQIWGKNIKEYDEYGNCISFTQYLGFNTETNNFDDEKVSKEINDITYLEDGTVKEYTNEIYNFGELWYKERHVYDDFIDRTYNGIDEVNSLKTKIQLFDDYVIILNNTEPSRYTIYDIQGRVLQNGNIVSSKISLEGLSAGSYILRIGNNSFKILKK